MGVVDLDEEYMPRGAPTMIDPEALGHRLTRIEDVRLFKFRGELLLMFEGMQPVLRPDGSRVRRGCLSIVRCPTLLSVTDMYCLKASYVPPLRAPAGPRLSHRRHYCSVRSCAVRMNNASAVSTNGSVLADVRSAQTQTAT